MYYWPRNFWGGLALPEPSISAVTLLNYVQTECPCAAAWQLIPVTCYLSSSCHVAHKASTLDLHDALSTAASRTSPHVLHPALLLSTSTVRLQVVLGLPRLLLPTGAHVRACTQSLGVPPQHVADEPPLVGGVRIYNFSSFSGEYFFLKHKFQLNLIKHH